jgi:hypothetical protein
MLMMFAAVSVAAPLSSHQGGTRYRLRPRRSRSVALSGRRSNGTCRRTVVPVSDGWIVGLDAGEFGGGLWWFSKHSDDSREISAKERRP